MRTEAILLAGGRGLRMGGPIPKQYLLLEGTPIAHYSFKIFEEAESIEAIVVVAEENYHPLFTSKNKRVKFALPGVRRQDSLASGMRMLDPETQFACIHDAARPFLSTDLLELVLKEAFERGASALALPAKATIKEVDEDQMVIKTLDRSRLWELQTPQVAKKEWLKEGLERAFKEGITATDDLALIELLGHPVKLVKGSERNLKITTAEDLMIAKALLAGKNHAL